jgi:hypothetical protein
MEEQYRFEQFDLGKHGDRHEQEFWPLLCNGFPTYEILWRRLIVPLTNRIDQSVAPGSKEWIRLRPGIPDKYERASMTHYSAFYFLGRAEKRFREDARALEHPEDVLFLLHSAGENLKDFLEVMNALGADCGCNVFDPSISQFPKGYDPFAEISDYRNAFLHNTVIGRGVGVGKIFVPRWNRDKLLSPLAGR